MFDAIERVFEPKCPTWAGPAETSSHHPSSSLAQLLLYSCTRGLSANRQKSIIPPNGNKLRPCKMIGARFSRELDIPPGNTRELLAGHLENLSRP